MSQNRNLPVTRAGYRHMRAILNSDGREAFMFPRANILVVESGPGQGESVTACLRRSLARQCSLARTDEDDVLYLANRYDFDCIVFGCGTDGERADRLSAVIKAIKPRMLIVALSVSDAGASGAAVRRARTARNMDADLVVPEQCGVLADMLRSVARANFLWYA